MEMLKKYNVFSMRVSYFPRLLLWITIVDNFVDNVENFDPNFKLSTALFSLSAKTGLFGADSVDNSGDNGENLLIHAHRIKAVGEIIPGGPASGSGWKRLSAPMSRRYNYSLYTFARVDKPVDNPKGEKVHTFVT